MPSEIAPVQADVTVLESTPPGLGPILEDFEGSSLEELDRVALLNRTDTKFLLAEGALLSVLPALLDDYRVLDIGGLRQHRYRTVYFDTPDWYLYHLHRTDEPVRHKVRSREYLDSGMTFLEVKSKDHQGRTIKHRMPTPGLVTQLSGTYTEFVAGYLPVDAAMLHLVLGNEFTRVTLVHPGDAERLTLDFGLRFDHEESSFALPGVAIAEVKQSGLNPDSPFLQAMANIDEEHSSVSKYCVGIARLYPDIAREAFQPALSAIEKLTASL
jgi:hypothetical protein